MPGNEAPGGKLKFWERENMDDIEEIGAEADGNAGGADEMGEAELDLFGDLGRSGEESFW